MDVASCWRSRIFFSQIKDWKKAIERFVIILLHTEDRGQNKTRPILQTGYFFQNSYRTNYFSCTHLSTSSLEMMSPFFKALMANSSLVFLYSAKITWSENGGKNAINSQSCFLLFGKINAGRLILNQLITVSVLGVFTVFLNWQFTDRKGVQEIIK